MSIMIQDFIMNILMYAILPLMSAFIIYLCAKATTFLKTQTKKINDETQRELINKAIDRVNDLAVKTVANIEQTTAKELREAVKDGKVDKEELIKLSQQATSEIYSQLTKDSKDALQSELNDVEEYIRKTVEKTLLDLKNNNK